MDTLLITTHTNGVYLCKLEKPETNDVAVFETLKLSFQLAYLIYSINRPGRLFNFCTLRVGAY